MSKTKIALLEAIGLVAVAVVVILALRPANDENAVLVLSGSSMRAVLEDIVERYKEVSDDEVVATYGGSGDLCAQIQKTGRGDIFISHDPFMPWAAKQGLIAEWATAGYMDVVVVVPKGNPKQIRGIEDLARPGIRLGIGDRTYSTSGVIVKHVLKKLDYGEAIIKNVRMETHGHQQRCTDVAMGTLDATIVWAAVAHLFRDKLDIIPIPRKHIDAITSATFGVTDLKNIKVTIGVTSHAADKESARKFYEFMTTKCMGVFAEYGFRPVGE